MPSRLPVFAALAALIASSCAALAQNPPAPKLELTTEKVLPLDLALEMVHGALDKCRAQGAKVSVALIDAAGNLRIALSDDGVYPGAIEIARKKAYTALVYKRPTSETVKAFANRVPL